MTLPEYRIGKLTLRPGRELVGEAGPIPIGGRALDLLSALARAEGGVVTKDELFAAAWDGAVVEENALQAQISGARKLLGAEARRLVTVHGRGYRLELSSDAPVAAAAPASVAVLPFANFSGDPAHAYLADGLAEELIATLSRVPRLKVASRTSSFAYRRAAADARAIARDLGVETVLEGSVRLAGDRIRVTAQLIEATSGYHLWSENFDRRFGDLFELQDDIAGAIAQALRAKLGGSAARPRDLDCYHRYMQAGALTDRARPEDITEAIALYREVSAREPDFAPAWARLAATLLYSSTTGLIPPSARAEARACAERAALGEPEMALAPMVLGGLDGLAGQWLSAEDNLRRAMRLDPGEPRCHSLHGYYLLAPCGHLERAQAAIEQGFALAPAAPLYSLGRATMAGLRGGGGGAVMRNLQMAETLGHSPDEPAIRAIRAAAALARDKWEEAAAHMAVAMPPPLRDSGPGAARLIYRALAGDGDKQAARAAADGLLATLEARGELARYQVIAGTLMRWQALLGALDAAFEVGARIIAEWRLTGHLPTMGLFQIWTPDMRPFREDPRFGAFVEDLGMVDYWRRHGPPDGHRLVHGRLVAQ